jgi:hypothetical protein
MIKITIKDPLVAIEAGEWCNENLGSSNWHMFPQNLMTNNPKYDFGFSDEQAATMFALRWAQHA